MATIEDVQTMGKTASISRSANERASRKIARFVGSFFIISNITFILGAIVLIESILGSPDYLTLVYEKRFQVILGVLLELINGFAYLGIAVLMFTIFKHRYEGLALGYVGLRIVEFIMQFASDISLLALLAVSENFLSAGGLDASSAQTLGTLLLAERFWAFQMLNLVFSISALVFYFMFYQTNLIPRFFAIWGLLGATLVLANSLLDMFGISLGIIGNLGILMLLNELVLGIWLIVKGFNPSAVASMAADQV
jgi:hypothetical protein